MAKTSSESVEVTKAPARSGGIKLKGQSWAWHHLFKTDLKDMKKNVSFKKGQPQIENLEHSHFFHSVNSDLIPQQFTSTIGGHFHEVTWALNAQGEPYVKSCSGPMTHKYVKKPGGQKRILTKVAWHDGNNDRDIVDDHTHEFTYLHSEKLSEEKIRSVQVENARTIEDNMREVGLEEGGA